ncbi:MAG: hypothetical protein WCJ58_05705 [bacterium]
MKKVSYQTKEYIVKLAGSCFWYWGSFHSFLKSCQVPDSIIQRYPKEVFTNKYLVMRGIIDELDSRNDTNTIQIIISEFYRLTKPVDDGVKDPKYTKELLEEFRNHVGKDPIDTEIENRKKQEKKDSYVDKILTLKKNNEYLNKLNQTFSELITTAAITQQNKGYKLEEIFYDLLKLEEFNYMKPYKIKTEQIDGHFKFQSFDYLVEIKFEAELIKKDPIAIFDNKIKSKAQSTRGFFLAPNGFDQDHVNTFEGNSPRLILMDGLDWIAILEGKFSFFDMLDRKVDELVKSGNIYFKVYK